MSSSFGGGSPDRLRLAVSPLRGAHGCQSKERAAHKSTGPEA